VLGGGAWGTAFASRLSAREKDFSVFLWSRDARASAEIQKERENKRYLPGMTVHDRLEVSSNLETLFENWQQIKPIATTLFLLQFHPAVS
jgi:glycerol-3-phosphate dehydrogenase (NAD(P)+)